MINAKASFSIQNFKTYEKIHFPKNKQQINNLAINKKWHCIVFNKFLIQETLQI